MLNNQIRTFFTALYYFCITSTRLKVEKSQGVQFDGRLGGAKRRPVEQRQAQVYRGDVERVDRPSKSNEKIKIQIVDTFKLIETRTRIGFTAWLS